MKILVSSSLVAALGVLAFGAEAASTKDVVTCTAQRLSQFVGPHGITQSWPVADELPARWSNDLGLLLSGYGSVMDGYEQRLYVDVDTQSAYIVEQGGIAGTRKIYGPLPIASCKPARAPLTMRSSRNCIATPATWPKELAMCPATRCNSA